MIQIEQVPGLYYCKKVISPLDSLDIINRLDTNGNWTPLSNAKTSRKVQHYGYFYNYTTYDIHQKALDMPDFVAKLRDTLTDKCRELQLLDDDFVFNQCIINNYEPGEGIHSHKDLCKFGPVIGCFTLGSGATMRFTNDDDKIVDLYTENGSLYIMSDDARHDWKHAMPSQKYDMVQGVKINRGRRVSVTFRNVPN